MAQMAVPEDNGGIRFDDLEHVGAVSWSGHCDVVESEVVECVGVSIGWMGRMTVGLYRLAIVLGQEEALGSPRRRRGR